MYVLDTNNVVFPVRRLETFPLRLEVNTGLLFYVVNTFLSFNEEATYWPKRLLKILYWHFESFIDCSCGSSMCRKLVVIIRFLL